MGGPENVPLFLCQAIILKMSAEVLAFCMRFFQYLFLADLLACRRVVFLRWLPLFCVPDDNLLLFADISSSTISFSVLVVFLMVNSALHWLEYTPRWCSQAGLGIFVEDALARNSLRHLIRSVGLPLDWAYTFGSFTLWTFTGMIVTSISWSEVVWMRFS